MAPLLHIRDYTASSPNCATSLRNLAYASRITAAFQAHPALELLALARVLLLLILGAGRTTNLWGITIEGNQFVITHSVAELKIDETVLPPRKTTLALQ